MKNIKPRKEDYEAALVCILNEKALGAGVDAKVRNVKILRRKDVVVADVIYRDTFDYHTERWNDKVFPLDEVEAEAERIRGERVMFKK